MGMTLNAQQRMVAVAHGAFVACIFVAAAWAAVVLGRDEPTDDPWPVSAAHVMYPVALVVAVFGLCLAVATLRWVRTGRRAVLFVANMSMGVVGLVYIWPLIDSPSFLPNNAVVVALTALAFGCGGLIAIVRSPSAGPASGTRP